MRRIDLSGSWGFCMDKEKVGIDKKYYDKVFEDRIVLPATVSTAKKGTPNLDRNTGYLTDPYLFEGYTWYSKDVEFDNTEGKELFLILERTRVSHVWVDGDYVGSNNSLCSTHRYILTPHINASQHKVTIMVDNTSYPVGGGHMTSPDTQTNWNGITGEISIEITQKAYLTGVKIDSDLTERLIKVSAVLNGTNQCCLTAVVTGDTNTLPERKYQLSKGENTFTYHLDETVHTWSEHNPKCYTLKLRLMQEEDMIEGQESDTYENSFGLRSFQAEGDHFEINGVRTFLRGKHDGMIFPMTGHAPTDTASWLKVMRTAKEYGINHYRFHTCCPPKAAFEAADILGIYMEPELPFWGTVTEAGDENHDEMAQQYLITEGYKILDEFGNHPSFVMMSMGNELWGSQSRINEILGGYKAYDSRHLYTQGSNNFQFMPCILENEDFFCGVRFSRDRLFRGSYAMCDAPQGHIQTEAPNMIHNYDDLIHPKDIAEDQKAGGDVTIQYGTGTKTVKMDAAEEIIPEIPVVSHEIGQYAMYPDFTEIKKYTGVLKARNYEVFQDRLEEEGMLPMADLFFKASARFSAECYKAELEAALRSSKLAGFQILDLQDFTGQGTAIIGILNSFMESKGILSSAEWRQFCSDTVLMAEFPKLVFKAGERVPVAVKLAHYSAESIANPKVKLILSNGNNVLLSEKITLNEIYANGVHNLCTFIINIPVMKNPTKLKIEIKIEDCNLINAYDLWVYPECNPESLDDNIIITDSAKEAFENLVQGKRVILYPDKLDATNSLEGTYCTDFWCYPMFRSISESMGRPVPIGTLGLLIDDSHAVFGQFPTKYYTTPQWYDIVSDSRPMILDGIDIEPLVWTIDNFERNHRLGNLFELKIGEGKLFVCTTDLRKLQDNDPAKWMNYSIRKYVSSKDFDPKSKIDLNQYKKIFSMTASELSKESSR